MGKRLVSAASALALALLLGGVPAQVYAEDSAGDDGTTPVAEVQDPTDTLELSNAERATATLNVVSLPTAAGITYGQSLEESTLTGGSVVTEDGSAVEGTFAWRTPWDIPDAGTRTYDVVFTPKGGGTAIHAGKVSVTIAQAAVTIT